MKDRSLANVVPEQLLDAWHLGWRGRCGPHSELSLLPLLFGLPFLASFAFLFPLRVLVVLCAGRGCPLLVGWLGLLVPLDWWWWWVPLGLWVATAVPVVSEGCSVVVGTDMVGHCDMAGSGIAG